MEDIFVRIQKSFHTSDVEFIYGRETEKAAIREFLNSNENILHITGKPGTGKTCTVKFVLEEYKNNTINKNNKSNKSMVSNRDIKSKKTTNKDSEICSKIISYKYINYYHEPIKSRIINSLTGRINVGSNKTTNSKSNIKNIKTTNNKSNVKNRKTTNNRSVKNNSACGQEYDIIVIDEFDKYFAEQKSSCLNLIVRLRACKKQLITISNNLKMSGLKFGPYTSAEIFNILKSKIEREILNLNDSHSNIDNKSASVIDVAALKYISTKFDKCGDLRVVFKAIFDIFNRVKSSKGKSHISILDCIERPISIKEKNIHHKIISDLVFDNIVEKEAFALYIHKCDEKGIPAFDISDFNIIYKLYQ